MTDQTPDLPTPVEKPPVTGGDLVIVRDLVKSFGDNHVLKGIDFTVPAGTVTAILGPSGSGKTTILRALAALDIPDGGVITIGDVTVDFSKPVPKETLRRYRAQSGMVFQSHNLFPHKTVLENVIEGPVHAQHKPREEAIARAKELLASVGLSEKVDQYPYQLSGGQQQRVGIARGVGARAVADPARRADLRTRPGTGRRGAGRAARLGDRRVDDGDRHPRGPLSAVSSNRYRPTLRRPTAA